METSTFTYDIDGAVALERGVTDGKRTVLNVDGAALKYKIVPIGTAPIGEFKKHQLESSRKRISIYTSN